MKNFFDLCSINKTKNKQARAISAIASHSDKINSIKKAIESKEIVSFDEFEMTSQRLEKLKNEIEHFESILKSLLGIEKSGNLEDALTRRVGKLKYEQKVLSNFLSMRDLPFPRLNLESLRWRDQNGMPRLVVFHPDYPCVDLHKVSEYGYYYFCYLFEDSNGHLFMHGKSELVEHEKEDLYPSSLRGRNNLVELPFCVKRCFDDVFEKNRLLNMPIYRRKSFVCQFNGLIPLHIKQKIQEAKAVFGDLIYLIVEIKDWQTKEVVIDDPLLVGFKGQNLWLITAFDTTPVEEAMIFTPPDR